MRWPYWIPFFFTNLGAIRAYGIDHAFGQIGEFIAGVEETYLGENTSLGWENTDETGITDSLGQATFWAMLIAATFLVAFFVWTGRIQIGDPPKISTDKFRIISPKSENQGTNGSFPILLLS